MAACQENLEYRKNAAKERRTHEEEEDEEDRKGRLARMIGLVVHPNGALYAGGM